MVMNTEQMFKLSTLHWQWSPYEWSILSKRAEIAPTNINIVKNYYLVKKIALPKMEFMTKEYFRMQKALMVCSDLK